MQNRRFAAQNISHRLDGGRRTAPGLRVRVSDSGACADAIRWRAEHSPPSEISLVFPNKYPSLRPLWPHFQTHTADRMAAQSKQVALSPWGNALAGALGAVFANTCVYPLDM
jgi:hypothetical protein